CAVGTSCHRGRAPLRQTLAVAPRHPAALQRRSLDCPWHTPRAEIVRLRGVPINRDAEEQQGQRTQFEPVNYDPVEQCLASLRSCRHARSERRFTFVDPCQRLSLLSTPKRWSAWG